MWWAGIEGEGGEVAEGAGEAPVVPAAQRVAVVLDEPEMMLLRKPGECGQVEWVPHGVGYEDCAGSWPDGFSHLFHDHVVRGKLDVHKDGYETVLDDGGYRGGEACRRRDYLIAGPELPLPEFGGGERAHRDEVGRGSGIDQDGVRDVEILREPRLELLGEAPRRQPEVE